MKKIIKIIIVVAVIALGIKIFTGKTVGTHYLNRIETQITENEKAHVGDSIKCPICGQYYIKNLFDNTFCSDDCKKKYEKIVQKVKKEQEVTQGVANVFDDTCESVKKNFKKGK